MVGYRVKSINWQPKALEESQADVQRIVDARNTFDSGIYVWFTVVGLNAHLIQVVLIKKKEMTFFQINALHC